MENTIMKKVLPFIISAGLILTYNNNAFASDKYVDFAKNYIEKDSNKSSYWDGPTTGPHAVLHKKVIFIASNLRNGGVLGVAQGFEEAAHKIGWKVRVLDGSGKRYKQINAVRHALNLKPDAIVIAGFNPNSVRIQLKQATKRGIQIIGWHASAQSGPNKSLFLKNNITTSPDEVAKLAAFYAIAESNGHAKVVLFTDTIYEIAKYKANQMKRYIQRCKQCQVLEYKNSSLAHVDKNMPKTTKLLINKHGNNYTYSLAINDLYYDHMVDTLKKMGKKPDGIPHNISAGDGSVSAFQRIRNGSYQKATVAEPLRLHGWQMIDELNRLFNHQSVTSYVSHPHLITKENVNLHGGTDNMYDPNNGYDKVYLQIWNR